MRLSKRHFVPVLLAGAACIGNVGCSSESSEPEPSGTPEQTEARLQAKLKADTGTTWKVHVDRRSAEVRFLAPTLATPLAGVSRDAKARAFFAKYKTELHASEHEELRVVDDATDSFGYGHVRFQHVLAGTDLPIFDATSGVEFAPGDALLFAQPGFRSDIAGVARTPTLSRADAEKVAFDHVRVACSLVDAVTAAKEATLGISAEEGAGAKLAWQIDIRTPFGDCIAPRVLVDATSGSVLAQRETAAFLQDRSGGVRYHHLDEKSDIKTIDVSPSWDVLGQKWMLRTEASSPRVRTQSYGWLNINADISTRKLGEWDVNSPAKGAAVDAHYYATKAAEYFRAAHGRNGIDGKGGEILVVVHDPEAASGGANAHYGDHGMLFADDQLHVGDGAGDSMPLSAGFDVLAHELAHGVTARTSKLIYAGESGALNEGFSDVMGAAAENWLPETSHPANNVRIGERFSRTGKALRDMSDPSGGGYLDRDHYKERLPCEGLPTGANDYCNVHRNSGIANRAFTLMTLGGMHKTSKVSVASGIGWVRARELWFNSFTKLRAEASFYEAALAQTAMAAQLGSAVLGAVSCAWFAVGVFEVPDLIGRNVGCLPASPPKRASCAGVADGVVCNELAPYSAFVCKNGSVATGILCSDWNTRCRKRAADDWTGTLANGKLVCE